MAINLPSFFIGGIMLAALILGLNLLTDVQPFDVYSVDNQYIESAYKMADEIMLHYDDLEDQEEIEVEEVPEEEIIEEIGEEIIEEDVPEELSDEEPSEEPIVYAVEGDNSEIVAELKKNNENWDLFLDSYVITDTDIPSLSSSIGLSINSSSSGFFNSSSVVHCVFYFPVKAGSLFSLSVNGLTSFWALRSGYSYVLPDSGVIPYNLISYDVHNYPNSFSGDFISPIDGFFYFYIDGVNSYNVSIDAYSFSYLESYTLSELGDAIISINEKVDNMTKFNDYEIYTDESSFENSVMYINKYQFETFKLLKYLVILAACQIGTLFLAIFTWRRSKHGNT